MAIAAMVPFPSDMMEGISSEAASLAGHLRLSNLCWIYDSNRVTMEGHTDIALTEDVAARFCSGDGPVPVTDWCRIFLR